MLTFPRTIYETKASGVKMNQKSNLKPIEYPLINFHFKYHTSNLEAIVLLYVWVEF